MPSPTALKPGVIKDPAIAALFSNKDPESRYDDLREIGHGSFGAVFFAFDRQNSEAVAIKKMSYSGKQASEKWADILKEVYFLNSIKHRHIVEYKACFMKEHTCWLVMEYCIGSAADIVDVLRRGLREVEIGVICSQTLDALIFLHSVNRIHRDIKAGNILLSDHAIVKLADFGSASVADPAHTFIGTPFFMAPEVILAMDDGSYTEKADVWSLGITGIELAERRPPLFNMNTMSALYHIAQNDPPTLAPITDGQPEWSKDFAEFIDRCLRKDPDDRISSAECAKLPFMTTQRPRDTIQELIGRTKSVVMELDNFQYKKMRKLIYLDEAEGRDSGSVGTESEDIEEAHNMDALSVDRGGDSTSSRSTSLKSLTSFRSMQSSTGMGNSNGGVPKRLPIPSTMRSDIVDQENRTTIPVSSTSTYGSEDNDDVPAIKPHAASSMNFEKKERNAKDDLNTLRKSKFSTLRSAKLISREQEEYNKENNMYEQMSGYKRLRQMHHKELQQLEERCDGDLEILRVRLDKELDQLQGTHGKERQRIVSVHQSEMTKKSKEVEDGARKLKKQTMTRQQREMSAFASMQLKEYKHNKELAKSSLKERGLSRSAYEQSVKEVKGRLARQKSEAEASFDAKLQSELDLEMTKYQRTQLTRMHSLEEKLDDEELMIHERQMETKHSLLQRHHNTTKEMELAQQKELHGLRKKHQDVQHEAETVNQSEYTQRLTDDLRKKHAMQSRQQPRELKIKEAQIRKQYRQAVKTQTRQFKLWQTQMMQTAPREEQKDIGLRLKDEQKRKIALLGSQYESQIENMVQEKTVKLETWQEDEAAHLRERLAKELEELITYQAMQKDQLEKLIVKERTALRDRIELRYALLTQRFEEERTAMRHLRESRHAALTEKHARERRKLDDALGAHTTAL